MRYSTNKQTKNAFTWVIILLLSGITACSQINKTGAIFLHPGYIFPYDLSKPDRKWELPATLTEISGLGYAGDQKLACIQDENAIIFLFDIISGKVETEIAFGDNGDYEDIGIIGNDAWILKSNGTLYEVPDYRQGARSGVNKYPTELTGKNDTEGLAYDHFNNKLLIACKELPFLKEEKKPVYRAVYSFDLKSKQLDKTPFLSISLDTVRFYNGGETFKPSGIAIHPLSGEIFILASVGKLLLVFSGKGEMLAMISLDSMIFRQPEGICFSPDGVLFISSEGAGGAGTIMKFDP